MSGESNCDASEKGLYARAYAACRAELESIPKARVKEVNLDVWRAISTAKGVLCNVRPLRDEILEQLPMFEIRWLDRLNQYAMALGHAQLEFCGTTKGLAPVDQIVAEAQKRYLVLFSDAQALALRGYIYPSALAKFGKRRGYYGLAGDLLGICGVLRHALSNTAGQTAITESDLAEAEVLGEQLLVSIARRKAPLRQRKQAAIRRDRAFTLFIEAYGQVRRAVQYLRWQGNEAERLMPSLYRRHRTRRAKLVAIAPAAPVQAEQEVTAPEKSHIQAVAVDEDPFESAVG